MIEERGLPGGAFISIEKAIKPAVEPLLGVAGRYAEQGATSDVIARPSNVAPAMTNRGF
ncbi:MAG: hypothetical protein LBJ01_00860 [Tannerella sp.]|jgi:hypothetical protein|nr:hypothetical protein [Tannerella sp.]